MLKSASIPLEVYYVKRYSAMQCDTVDRSLEFSVYACEPEMLKIYSENPLHFVIIARNTAVEKEVGIQ